MDIEPKPYQNGKGAMKMKMFKDMKIKSKLLLGFALVLAITVGITAYGGIYIMHIDAEYSHAMSFPMERWEILGDLETKLMDAQRAINRAGFSAEDRYDPDAELTRQEEYLDDIRVQIDNLIDSYRRNLIADNRLEPADRASRDRLITDFETEVHYYFDEYIAEAILAMWYGAGADAFEITRDSEATLTRAMASYNTLFEAEDRFMGDIGEILSRQSLTTLLMLVGLALGGILASFVIALIISHSITAPIQKVVYALGDVANGKLNVNITKSDITKNETGILTRDLLALVDVIKSMVDDLIKLDRKYNTVGDIDYRIDSRKYRNAFKDMIEGVNNIPEVIVDDVLQMIDGLNKINEGNFSPAIKDMPGKKMVLPNALRDTVANLQNINAEVTTMIEAAAVKGNLQFKVDADKYQGDWRRIMIGLNDIAEAVNQPITEIKNAMSALDTGKFDTLVSGDYAGDFLDIKNSVNSTIKGLDRYIQEIDSCLSAVSEGNLTRYVSRDIEFTGNFSRIKESIDNIVKTLNKTMSDILLASNQVLSGAIQISSSASDLANGAQQQASSVQELTASIDMINQQTKQNAESAFEANSLSEKSTVSANAGNEAMEQMLVAMAQIKESSNNISKIIKTIQDIAFQTNLLSLNASVEAARAGEHGKGFSVVADEVRSLAGRSQTAAVETTGLIKSSIERVDAGSSIAETTSKSLKIIVDSASAVLNIINSISASSREQAEAIAQVSAGLSQISQIVQSNSAISEETAAASQELNSQAELLQELMRGFKL